MTAHHQPRRLLLAAGLAALLATAALPGRAVGGTPDEPPEAVAADAADAFVVDRDRERVAPGLVHTSLDTYDPLGWVRADVLTADLRESGLDLQYLSSGAVSEPTPLSQQVDRAGAVAGVNADFFDINDTGAPLGVGIDRDAGVVHGPATGQNATVSVDADGAAWIGSTFLEASVTLPSGAVVPVANLNSPAIAADGIGVYTPLWGSDDRADVIDGDVPVREVTVRDDVVTSADDAPGSGPIPAGAIIVLGVGAGADQLAEVAVGDEVAVDLDVRTEPLDPADTDRRPVVTAGGNTVLLDDGEPVPNDDPTLAPRTAIGIDDDTDQLVMLTVDGRQADSRGLSMSELAQMLVDMGVEDALNLDGGGSSTMLAREAGEQPAVVNQPSDGAERDVPDGLGWTVAPGGGRLTGLAVEPRTDADESREVLAGLTRTVIARGHDETLAPVATHPRWRATGAAEVGAARGAAAVVTGIRPGPAHVEARDGRASGRLALHVLGRPVRIGTDVDRVSLPDVDATGAFRVLGYDHDGFSTGVEPRDVRLRYDHSVVALEEDTDGFVVTPKVADGSTVVRVGVGRLVTRLGVTVGLKQQAVADLDAIDGWSSSTAPSVVTADIESADGHDGTPGIALNYSLTGSTATRAAYLDAPADLTLPGNPQRLTAWVNGDGQGGWVRAVVVDGAGVSTNLTLAEPEEWTGWRELSAEIPPGLTRPLTLRRMYVVETVPARQYDGRLVFDDVAVQSAPDVDVPEPEVVPDSSVVTDGRLGKGRWRFAVMSDAQFVGSDPDSDLVAQARRTLREIVAADPDFVVVLGDFVDTGFDGDLDLAQRVLDEELGVGEDQVLPYYYVPGNHEAYGVGDLSAWEERFGEAVRTFEHRHTRLVMLDSSLGSFRLSDFGQWLVLRQALDDAATDPQVRSVIVMAHHPAEDPADVDNSELADPKESALLREWLARFRAETGKGAAYLSAHAGAFSADRVDGVPYLVNGNSGKAPAAAPDEGGFTGWSMVGVSDRTRRPTWMRVELRPHVDELVVEGPARLAVGHRADVAATVVQGDREVPVAYPVTADWSASPRVRLPGEQPRPDDVARFDPATGRLVALRPGRARLEVTVNETTRSLRVRLVR